MHFIFRCHAASDIFKNFCLKSILKPGSFQQLFHEFLDWAAIVESKNFRVVGIEPRDLGLSCQSSTSEVWQLGEMSKFPIKGLASSPFDFLLIFLCTLIQTLYPLIVADNWITTSPHNILYYVLNMQLWMIATSCFSHWLKRSPLYRE